MAYDTLIDPVRRRLYDRSHLNGQARGAIPVLAFKQEDAEDEDGIPLTVFIWECRCGTRLEGYSDTSGQVKECSSCSIVWSTAHLVPQSTTNDTT